MANVITGGPGVGKTTLCDALAARGYPVMPEAARDIIAQEQKRGGDLPWLGKEQYCEFQRKVMELQLEREARSKGDAFLDRGVIDNIAYCRVGGVPLPRGLAKASRERKYDVVFLLDPLAHYATDAQRVEDTLLARQLHAAIEAVYIEHGYTPVHVPAIGIEARVEFVLSALKQTTVKNKRELGGELYGLQ